MRVIRRCCYEAFDGATAAATRRREAAADCAAAADCPPVLASALWVRCTRR